MKSIEERLAELMTEWAALHHDKGYKVFIGDGAVNWSVWNDPAIPRICFVLKEAYGGESDWDLCDYLSDGDKRTWKTWSRVAVITKALQEAIKGKVAYNRSEIEQKRDDRISSIAVVSIKKSNGASKSCDDDLRSFAREDVELISRELEILAPDVIVCGHTNWLIRGLVVSDDRDPAANEIAYRWGNSLVIDFHHPVQHTSAACDGYYAIAGACLSAINRGLFSAPL